MQIGDISVERIMEMVTPFMRPEDMFPDASMETLNAHRSWMEPAALCPQTGKIIINIQTYIIRTPQHTILVDTCIGCDKTNHYFAEWHQRSDHIWFDRLLAHGLDPAEVDYVFCTHLHGDHCGWNTRLIDGRWVPTFPNARYIISETEIRHSAAAGAPAYQESVLPCIETGQVIAAGNDFALDDNVWVEPTPGHTPGHIAVHLKSGKQRAVLCGDVIHSPIQCLYPHWQYWIDYDSGQANDTRRKFLEEQCEQQRLVLTAHFPGSSMGYVKVQEEAFNFEFVEW